MPLAVRSMDVHEAALVVDYFHGSSAEHLDLLGVDPSRLPDRETWLARYRAEYDKPVPERSVALVVWEDDGETVGFSTADKIVYGGQANMHLHVIDPDRRGRGIGTECVRRTAALYFETLAITHLFCQPNAFNVAPNRTLQSAGFRYVKTYMTVPGPLNYRQAVTRWVLTKPGIAPADERRA
jgi:RimJ/RimL family protein N-acetyltransferase